MARCSGQKLKLLYLLDIFKKHTDKDTFITMEQILALLEKHNIFAERKSIYEDISALKEFGLDIELVRNKGYHLVSRTFETSELKLLVDAVQASKFITEKKSNELIKKLESLTSKNNASELQHSVIMRERIKTMNESVFLTVDKIQLAMGKNKKLSFKYFDWDVRKNKVYKKDGKSYVVSPQALTWDDENYYLLAFDEDAKILKHFRVDKMTALFILEQKRSIDTTVRFDTAEYSKKMFGMYGGVTKKVKLRCNNSLAGVFIDRFGLNSIITPLEDSFEIIVEAAISPVFLSWLMQFGDKITVLSPESVKKDLINLAEKVINSNS
ncbi:MAG: WYL domain-containing transcriptional regulator [Clostridiales bacterium]|nr:WYL domain-containing transcriptional regulator [Clostridiales bacterium]